MMNADVIVVGGGLAGGLLALRLALSHPDKRLLLLEKGPSLGGNHTWCFPDSDLRRTALEDAGSNSAGQQSGSAENDKNWLDRLIYKSWTAHEVRFPKLQKTVDRTYHAIRSDRFHAGLMDKLGRHVRLNCRINRLTSSEVEMSSGEILRAPLIVDARGPGERSTKAEAALGWHKFIGFDMKLKHPHGLTHPVIQDARGPQMDGYRYFAYFPWSETEILVREHFFSSTPDLNDERISRSILAYVERSGWELESVIRKEHGALPLTLFVTPDAEKKSKEPIAIEFSGEDFIDDTPVSVSTGSLWFHSSTGYSIADAVRVAEFIAGLKELRTGPVRTAMRDFRKQWTDQQKFYRLVNRMLFRASEPGLRYQILERFYALPDDLIERFSAGVSLSRDRTKILATRPPIRMRLSLRNWREETI